MYGNFTSNLYKLNFTHYIFKYNIEITPAIPDNTLDVSLYNEVKKNLATKNEILSINNKNSLYTNKAIPIDLKLMIKHENISYIVIFLQSSNLFLTEKDEQKQFLKLLIKEYLMEFKYLKFSNSFFNPFEKFDDKVLDISRWNGFSIQIKQFFNDFALQITPKNLIFNRKNCLENYKKIIENDPFQTHESIKSCFKGHLIKTRCASQYSFYKIKDIIFPNKKMVIEDEEILDQDENICFLLENLKNTVEEPLVLSMKCCSLMGYFDEMKIIDNYKDTCHNAYRQINHFMTVLTRNPKFRQVLIDWKLVLASTPNSFQLFKLDSNQIMLSNLQKTLNILSFSLNKFIFDQQYKIIFNDAPLLNFPSLENWVFFLHHENVEIGDLLLAYFHTIVKKFGYNVIKPHCVLIDSYLLEDWIPKIYENLNKSHQFSMILIPTNIINQIEFYEKTKMIINGEIGIPSQFIQAKTLETNKSNDGFYMRLLSQIAAKMGFAPWALKDLYFSGFPTLAIGVNISYTMGKSTIISVVGSMNKDFSKYWSIFSIVKSQASYINEISLLVIQVVAKFFLVHNVFPQHLIVFRDGELIKNYHEEKEILNKNIEDFKKKEKIIDDNLIQLVYIKVKISYKEKILSVENINSLYQQKISNPFLGSVMKTSENFNKFYVFLQRNDNDQHLNHPTKFLATVFNNSINNIEYFINLQNFCFQLVFLNFTLSSRTCCPAPLQYAYKLSKMVQLVDNNKKNKEHFMEIFENLKSLSGKGKLYFI